MTPVTHRRLLAVPALTLVGVLAACSGGDSGGQTSSSSSSSAPTSSAPTAADGQPSAPPVPDRCQVDAKGRPTSCAALWGASLKPPTVQNLVQTERKTGRDFDFVYRYHDLGGTIPDKNERAVVARGQLLHIAIASRHFGGQDVPYSDIIAGKYDDVLRRQAEGVKSIKAPVYMTFEQEGNQKDKAGAKGTPEEYKQAWRHLHEIYQQAGVTNAVWVWVMTGNAENVTRAGAIWPGNDVVDWISWNVYNSGGCRGNKVDESSYTSFTTGVKTFYDWVKKDGPKYGIDTGKPMMISEAGSALYPGNPGKSAGWYKEIPGTLKKYPQIEAIALWGSRDTTNGKNCDYRFQDDATVTAGVKDAGNQLKAKTRSQ